MKKPALFLSAMGVTCALGSGHRAVLEKLLSGDTSGMVRDNQFIADKALRLGKVREPLPAIADSHLQNSRNNQLLLAACQQVETGIDQLKTRFGSGRIGVVIGTSTSGTLEAEAAIQAYCADHKFHEDYDYRVQEMGDPSRFLAEHLDLKGPCYSISTACSSSGKVFSTARNLIQAGLCDAAIVGGVDSLCQMTVQGFSALESVSAGLCSPLGEERDGINLGEGAALFLVTTEVSDIALLGIGESSDAWHISAPHPEGRGAESAMRAALANAGLSADQISYLNLHGTATPLNDVMESKAALAVLGSDVLCSSTKRMTGHTLGAAGAIEAAVCWLLLSDVNAQKKLPPHGDHTIDPDLPALRLTRSGDHLANKNAAIMSNSFAFGGSNVSLILGRCDSE